LNNTFATVGFQDQWEGVQKWSESEELPCDQRFNAFKDRAENQHCT